MPERKAFLMRIDPDLYEALSRWAVDELRSLNGQIEYLLRQATVQSGRAPRRGGTAHLDRAKGGGSRERGPR